LTGVGGVLAKKVEQQGRIRDVSKV
jgi:hypothetical protein